jgi:hypothetical protein
LGYVTVRRGEDTERHTDMQRRRSCGIETKIGGHRLKLWNAKSHHKLGKVKKCSLELTEGAHPKDSFILVQ